MKKRMLGRFMPFTQLPRGKRRDRYISLRWRIRREASTYGGKFTSDLVLDEPGRPKLYNQWFHFYFLGKDGVTIWNTYISTAAFEFWKETSSLASERAISLLTAEQREQECGMEFSEPFFRNGEKCYTLEERKQQGYDCFGGLTLNEYTKKCELEIIENDPPEIFESFRMDRSFRYGTGLYAVVSVEEIDRGVIEKTIERFYETGENNWQSSQAVPRETLPRETEVEALSKTKYSSNLAEVEGN